MTSAVKFADVVRLNTDRVTDPASAGIDRFVGLEHIEPENLHIRANDGNLSIPLYVRGKAFGEEKGKYAADSLKGAVLAWKKSSEVLHHRIKELIFLIEEGT